MLLLVVRQNKGEGDDDGDDRDEENQKGRDEMKVVMIDSASRRDGVRCRGMKI